MEHVCRRSDGGLYQGDMCGGAEGIHVGVDSNGEHSRQGHIIGLLGYKSGTFALGATQISIHTLLDGEFLLVPLQVLCTDHVHIILCSINI